MKSKLILPCVTALLLCIIISCNNGSQKNNKHENSVTSEVVALDQSETASISDTTKTVARFDFNIIFLNVRFFNESRNASYYKWDFGDGTTDSIISPIHNYTKDGVYKATLEVWGPYGTDTVWHEVEVLGATED